MRGPDAAGAAARRLLAAPGGLIRRLRLLGVAGLVMLAVSLSWIALSWIALYTFTPAADRPCVDGSTNNSAVAMVFGEIGWLYPLAILALIAGLAWRARARRTDPVRAGLVMWGGWLVMFGVIYSVMSNIPHTAYTASLAPPLVRENSLYLSRLAEDCILLNEIELACETATRVLELGSRANSARTDDRLRHLATGTLQRRSSCCRLSRSVQRWIIFLEVA